MMGCTRSPLSGAAIHNSGTWSRLAPRDWKMRLTLAFCRPKANCRPRKPKHMFQICQNDTNGLDGGGIRIHGDVSTTAQADGRTMPARRSLIESRSAHDVP